MFCELLPNISSLLLRSTTLCSGMDGGLLIIFTVEWNSSSNRLVLKGEGILTAYLLHHEVTISWNYNFFQASLLFCRFWKIGRTHSIKRCLMPQEECLNSLINIIWNHLHISCSTTLIAFMSVICILNWFLKILLENTQIEEIKSYEGVVYSPLGSEPR